jgi:ElaB/YqjD/DUF883 family membrane-anchored ribosome-binding protein
MGSDAIRGEIETTRAEMTETVDAIQARLSPQNIQETTEQVMKQAKETALEITELVTQRIKETIHEATVGRVEKMMNNVRDTSRGASASLLEIVKENPIPAAMIGIGIAWLMVNKSNASYSDRHYHSQGWNQSQRWDDGQNNSWNQRQGDRSGQGVRSMMHDRAEQVSNTVGEAASNLKEKAENFVDQAQDRVGDISSRVQDQARQVGYSSRSMLEENPLVAGAIALALGAAIGFALPETQRENELMGEARDRFMDQASEVARGTAEKVQRVAGDAIQAAQDTIKAETQRQGPQGPMESYQTQTDRPM